MSESQVPADDEARLRQAHGWNPRTGTCKCGWESPSERGAERLHQQHVERLLRGYPR